MPKPNSNREKKLLAAKKRMKKSGMSVFLLLELGSKPKKKKKGR